MSSTKVQGWMLVNCLENQKASWLKKRAAVHEEYRLAIIAGLRAKWWQFFTPRTFEEAIADSSDYFSDVYRYKDSTPEAAEKDWQRKWKDIKRLADHAVNTGGDVVLDEDQSYLLTFYKAPL